LYALNWQETSILILFKLCTVDKKSQELGHGWTDFPIMGATKGTRNITPVRSKNTPINHGYRTTSPTEQLRLLEFLLHLS
jgi:hypothetical protein